MEEPVNHDGAYFWHCMFQNLHQEFAPERCLSREIFICLRTELKDHVTKVVHLYMQNAMAKRLPHLLGDDASHRSFS